MPTVRVAPTTWADTETVRDTGLFGLDVPSPEYVPAEPPRTRTVSELIALVSRTEHLADVRLTASQVEAVRQSARDFLDRGSLNPRPAPQRPSDGPLTCARCGRVGTRQFTSGARSGRTQCSNIPACSARRAAANTARHRMGDLTSVAWGWEAWCDCGKWLSAVSYNGLRSAYREHRLSDA